MLRHGLSDRTRIDVDARSLADFAGRTAGEKTTEPSVIGWMPSAQLYFRDRDGHSLEFF